MDGVRSRTVPCLTTLTNSRGDVIALYDGSGKCVVEYEYDAWGNCTIVSDSTGFNFGKLNPIRYRGYYYDSDTGLYYLQSRYYDPQVGRFLNADGTLNGNGDVLGYNMFAYCGNNPVNKADPTGTSWIDTFFRPLRVSIMMLRQAFYGNGVKQSYSQDSPVSIALSKSENMSKEIISNFENHNKTNQKNFTDTVSFYEKGNLYDTDLLYSVGKASYTMSIKEETKTTGFWVFKKTEKRCVASVVVSDVYDFTEIRNDDTLGSKLNNWGVDMQNQGYITPYNWDASFTVYSEWERVS